MRKTILLAEYLRLSELIAVSSRMCPVCETSDKLKQRYKGTHCSSADFTACHPEVQKRCKTILDIQTSFEEKLKSYRYNIRQQLIWDYNISIPELRRLYHIWIEERNQL